MTPEQIRKEVTRIIFDELLKEFPNNLRKEIEKLCLQVRDEALEEAIESVDDGEEWGRYFADRIRSLKAISDTEAGEE